MDFHPHVEQMQTCGGISAHLHAFAMQMKSGKCWNKEVDNLQKKYYYSRNEGNGVHPLPFLYTEIISRNPESLYPAQLVMNT